jgi:alpha-mannosidase
VTVCAASVQDRDGAKGALLGSYLSTSRCRFVFADAGFAGGSAGVAEPQVSLDGDAASIEAVKIADDRSGDVVVRVHESLGGRAHTRLRASFPMAGVEVTDLLERPLPEESATVTGDGSVPLTLRPFQVLTLRLRTGG